MSELLNKTSTSIIPRLIELKVMGDERGKLVALESGINVPFEINRVYYIFDTKNGIHRGLHTHIKLQQYLVCVSGECKILLDDGRKKEIFHLDTPSIGVYVGPMIWREMYDFSPDCVLLVLASDFYDEQDYIRNYEDFLELLNNKG
jgi:dTDP-4-dehydrorhamnose 3,5-epimerase-like enzyme